MKPVASDASTGYRRPVLPLDADGQKVVETLNGALGGFARLHPWALPNADVERDLLQDHPERDSLGRMLTVRQAEVLDCLLVRDTHDVLFFSIWHSIPDHRHRRGAA